MEREIGLQRALSETVVQRVIKMARENAEHVFGKMREKQREKLARCLQTKDPTERQNAKVKELGQELVIASTYTRGASDITKRIQLRPMSAKSTDNGDNRRG